MNALGPTLDSLAIMKLSTLLACLAVCGGCAYQSVVDVAPAYDVASSYSQKIPGEWALYVNADDFAHKTVHMKGFACSAHRFPIRMESAFAQSALRTTENLVANVRLVDAPLPSDVLLNEGLAGQIVIEAEELEGDLVVIAGFWSNKIEAEVEMVASVTVDGLDGRLLGTTVAGDEEAIRGAGAFCGGGAKALSDAGAGAMRKALREIAEAISNSPRIRDYVI